jgi:hypothetical protein
MQSGAGAVSGQPGETTAGNRVPAPLRITGIHARKHEFFHPTCFTCKLSTLKVGDLQNFNRADREWSADNDAYKRLRADGLQPNSVKGSAGIEGRITDQIELDFKMPIPKNEIERVKDIQSEVALSQWTGDDVA